MEKILTPEFRVSFPNVFTPKSFEGKPPKYSIIMLFQKDADLTKLQDLVDKAIEERWPNINTRPKNLRSPFRDGDTEKAHIEGYQNTIFASASSSKRKPGVVDTHNVHEPIMEEEFYAGCYAKASLTVYAYPKETTKDLGNRGVSFGLQNIMKTRDGTPFDGTSSAEVDFAEFKTDITKGNIDMPEVVGTKTMFD